MMGSALSDTTVRLFSENYTPGIWLYPRATTHALKWTLFYFLNTHFESIGQLLVIKSFFLVIHHTPLLIMRLNFLLVSLHHLYLYSGYL